MEYFTGELVYGDNVYIDEYYMDEKWSFIKGFSGYMISNKARVWSSKTQSFLKAKRMDAQGHLGVCLYQNGKAHYRYLHRLVAEAFIPNPNKFPIVRHLYDQKDANEECDLLWGTMKDNAADTFRNGNAYYPTDEDRYKGNKYRMTPLIANKLETGEKLYFESQSEASKKLRIHQSNIWKVLRGQRSHAKGYSFREVRND